MKISRTFSKFILIGIFATILNYLIFIIFYSILNINYLYASAIGFIHGVMLSLYCNKNWTFEYQGEFSKILVTKYLSVYAVGLLVSLLFLEYSVKVLLINPLYANFLSIIITTLTNFIGLNWMVFKEKK